MTKVDQSLQRSMALFDQICELIRSKGPISFKTFMDKALYTPELGYYMQSGLTLGQDFITSPQLGPWFAASLAQASQPLLKACPAEACVVEFGPGSGQLCYDFLMACDRSHTLPDRYYLVEISPSLRALQAHTCETLPAHLKSRIEWVDACPEMSGVVIANEFIDAWPIDQFALMPDIQMRCVDLNDEGALTWRLQPLDSSDPCYQAVESLSLERVNGFYSEIQLDLNQWFRDTSAQIKQGGVLLIDYGLTERMYYDPGRMQGTLRCHSGHRVHDDPLFQPGTQDITAKVNWTAVARAALASGWTLSGDTDQASFLMKNGLERELMQREAPLSLEAALQIKQLTLPTEMGQAFQVLGLSKHASMSCFDACDRQPSLWY